MLGGGRKPSQAKAIGCFAIVVVLISIGIVAYSSASHDDGSSAWNFRGTQIALDLRQLSAAQTSGNTFDMAKAAQSLAQHCHDAEGLPHGNSNDEQHIRNACAAAGFPLPAP